jgi:hypothetical protein
VEVLVGDSGEGEGVPRGAGALGAGGGALPGEGASGGGAGEARRFADAAKVPKSRDEMPKSRTYIRGLAAGEPKNLFVRLAWPRWLPSERGGLVKSTLPGGLSLVE